MRNPHSLRLPRRAGTLRHQGERGIAAVELALVAPLLVLIVVGGLDLYRYVQARAIVDRAAFTVAYELALDPSLPYSPAIGLQLFTPLAPTGTDGIAISVHQRVDGNWRSCRAWPGVPAAVNASPPRSASGTVVVVTATYSYTPLSTGQTIWSTFHPGPIRGLAYTQASNSVASALCTVNP